MAEQDFGTYKTVCSSSLFRHKVQAARAAWSQVVFLWQLIDFFSTYPALRIFTHCRWVHEKCPHVSARDTWWAIILRHTVTRNNILRPRGDNSLHHTPHISITILFVKCNCPRGRKHRLHPQVVTSSIGSSYEEETYTVTFPNRHGEIIEFNWLYVLTFYSQ